MQPLTFRSRIPVPLLILTAFLLSTSGCGSSEPSGTVIGLISANHAPVPGGVRICLMSPQTGYAIATSITENGTFQFGKSIPVGGYVVFVSEEFGNEEPPDGDFIPRQSGKKNLVGLKKLIPAKYWNEITSNLKIDVQEGKNDVNIEIPAAS
ncbi:carboxypeptidase-like regulatory domain-containing protein [Gimesia fumaroli]|uniref:Carboxypeptidase regulatory-like domain-containing protein n=1 Tax=Gimesia fumaroli TaxID=2527976 RepID=A0A518I9R6_9PLAN|nr:carboxypeptidase-like regulatory domain-containing protein [Gimesia fumaroli]QDV49847.1 hypothetical protein Enr17x_18680 [Gimesia fumaroli]